jgi:FkbM family methyltransferase
MAITAELWNEYLVVFWSHPINSHQYFRGGVTIDRGDIVLDSGACEGFFTRKALEAGASKVICVEPSATMVKCLEKTFATEILAGSVSIEPTAIGTFCGSAGFSSDDEDAFSGHFDGLSSNLVEVTTLGKIVANHGRPSFIKMDLEGSEYQALSGGVDFLKEFHPKVGITTYHNPWDYAVVSALLKSVGYKMVKPYGVTLRDNRTPRPVMVHGW